MIFSENTKKLRHVLRSGLLLAFTGVSSSAAAQASAGGSLSLSSDGASATTSAQPAPSGGADVPYMMRYPAEDDLWELGLFGGVMFPSSSHNLLERGPQQDFDTALELGARFAYYPLSFLGAELEGAGMPSGVEDGSDGGLYAGRGHLIGQLPLASITPFVLFGAGALGGASSAMGSDVDPAVHFGAGAKAALNEYLSVRLDLRDTMSQKYGETSGTLTHHPELLLGLSFTLERTQPDADGDGFADHRDECLSVPGEHQGCPAPDQDKDGVADDADQCQDVAGVAPTGCPDSEPAHRAQEREQVTRGVSNVSELVQLLTEMPV